MPLQDGGQLHDIGAILRPGLHGHSSRFDQPPPSSSVPLSTPSAPSTPGPVPARAGTTTADSGVVTVFEKLTDSAQFTGAHRLRFDMNGKGRGLSGRDRMVKGKGTEILPLALSGHDGVESLAQILRTDDDDAARVKDSAVWIHAKGRLRNAQRALKMEVGRYEDWQRVLELRLLIANQEGRALASVEESTAARETLRTLHESLHAEAVEAATFQSNYLHHRIDAQAAVRADLQDLIQRLRNVCWDKKSRSAQQQVEALLTQIVDTSDSMQWVGGRIAASMIHLEEQEEDAVANHEDDQAGAEAEIDELRAALSSIGTDEEAQDLRGEMEQILAAKLYAMHEAEALHQGVLLAMRRGNAKIHREMQAQFDAHEAAAMEHQERLRVLPERLTPELMELCGGTKVNRDELQMVLGELRWRIDSCVLQHSHVTTARTEQFAAEQAAAAVRVAGLKDAVAQQDVAVQLPEVALATAKKALQQLRSEMDSLEQALTFAVIAYLLQPKSNGRSADVPVLVTLKISHSVQ
jgi:hypothetical protein